MKKRLKLIDCTEMATKTVIAVCVVLCAIVLAITIYVKFLMLFILPIRLFILFCTLLLGSIIALTVKIYKGDK